MTIFSGRPRVIIQELDLGTRVPTLPGVYVGAIIKANKGKVGVPTLMTTIEEFLFNYTERSRITVDDDVALYGILATLRSSNKVYVTRAAVNPLYGGVYLKQDYPVANAVVTVEDDEVQTTWNTFNISSSTDRDLFFDSISTGEKVKFSGTSLPTGINDSTVYYVIKLINYQFMLATSYANAVAGTEITLTSTGTGTITVNLYPNSGSALTNGSVEYGMLTPENYVFDTSSGKDLNQTSVFTLDTEKNALNVIEDFYNCLDTTVGDYVRLTASTFPTVVSGAALDNVTDYYVIQLGSNQIQLARTLNDATNGVYIGFEDNGSTIVATLQGKASTSTVTPANATDDFTVSANFYNLVETGDPFIYTVATTYPTVDAGDALDSVTTYYIIKSTTNKVKIARSSQDAQAGVNIGFSTDGTGAQTFTLSDKNIVSSAIVDLTTDDITVSESFYSQISTGNTVNVSTTNTLPTYRVGETLYTLSDSVTYYLIKGTTTNTAKIALTKSQANLGISIDFINDGAGTNSILLIEDNAPLYGVERKCLLIYGKDQGTWNNNLYVETVHYPYGDRSTWTTDQEIEDANLVGEENSFLLRVYRKEVDNTYTLLEEHICSRDKNKTNGYGRSLYVETVLDSSPYVSAIDNLEIHNTVLPINQTTKLQLLHGDNGSTVSEDVMLNLVSKYESTKDIRLTLFPDYGYAVPSFQRAIDAVCAARRDSFAILSTPIDYEFSSTNLRKVIDYRNKELNLNSSFSALYCNHLYIQDQFNNRKIYVDPTGYVANSICNNANEREIWYAPAGQFANLDVLDVSFKWTDGQMDDLYNNGINFVENYPGRGIRVEGQKTLYYRTSPLNRCNVRLMLIVVQPAIKAYLDDFKYTFNDAGTRSLVKSGIDTYLGGIVSRLGIESFFTVCNEKNNTNEDIANNIMNVWVIIQPKFVVEYIRFLNIITSTNATSTYDIVNSIF